ncbi:MATE family efflux transporter [Pseudomonas maumuensis]|uniref:Polysaccharide biosynthesis C-terminal domain-containing protein n=1 Tax=Pseudomonas maumuensis TaxID=2842354 RepID=A0ABX8ND33_9PSED|nr:MATE family efflux transporter [Pseudomonas maumuensis]QXH54309.1 polysaccharide biosynthesis C-terminal domain-containing protein [Pseudomonas maumuensis]
MQRWFDAAVAKRIAVVSFPLMGTMVGNLLMMLVDRLCLAHYSPATLAASGPAVFTSMAIIAFFCSTVGVTRSFVAQANGRSGLEEARGEGALGLFLGLACGALLFMAAPLIALIPQLSSRPAQIVSLESQYMLWAAIFGGVMAINTALSSFFNGVGRTRETLMVGIVGQVVDSIFTVGLVFGKFGLPEMGMAGAAIGTLIGTLSMLGCYAVMLPREVCRELLNIFIARSEHLWSRLAFRLRRGVPSGLSAGVDQLGNTAFIWIVAVLGTSALAANNVNLTINYLGIIPIIGLGIGCSILCATAAGKQQYAELATIVRVTVVIELIYVLLVSTVQVTMPQVLLKAFGDLGHNQEIIDLAIDTQRVLWTFSGAFAFSMTGAAVLESIGMARFSLVVRLLLMWFMSIPLIYYVAMGNRDDPSSLVTCWIIGSVFELAIGLIYFWRIAKAVRGAENRLQVNHRPATEDAL